MARVLDLPIDRVLAAFPAAHETSEDQWEACCPAHTDTRPSLAISIGEDDRVLIYCHAGCEPASVVAAVGLTMSDLHRSSVTTAEPLPVVSYHYTDEDGVLLFEVIRTIDKRFWQQAPDGEGGIRRSVKGVRKVLYRLPEVIAAVANGETIWIVEGEKDADRLVLAGMTATCNPGGAGKWNRVPDAASVLAGADVVVVADNDPPGLDHALEIARSVRAVGCAVRVVQARTGKDVSDHLNAGLDLDDLDDLDDIDDVLADVPIGDSGTNFTRGGSFILDIPDGVPAVWGDGDDVLWAEGEPLIIAGPPGVGKSTLLSNVLRARLGLANEALGYTVKTGARVLYLACDRPAQIARLLNRIFSASERTVLDDRLVVLAGPPPGDLAKDPGLLRRLAEEVGADTVIIDSLKDVAMKLSDDDVGAAVNRSVQECVANGIEVAALHHTRKTASGGGQPKSLDDIYGSRWLTAGAGSVLVLWGNAGDPVVDLLHRKQPASKVGPLRIEHNAITGRSRVLDARDDGALLEAVGADGVDAATFARMLTGTTPTEASRKSAIRKLNGMVEEGKAHVVAPRAGSSRSTPNRYRAAAFGPFTVSETMPDASPDGHPGQGGTLDA